MSSFRLVGVVLVSGAMAMACASGSRQPTAQPAPASPAMPDSIRWVRDSAESVASTVQAYRLVTQHVENAVRGRAPATWAVVLDADDTVINNTQYQVGLARDGVGHTPERFTAWVRQRASTPVPGAARFLTRVRGLGGRIAIVTNRLAIECDDTAAVFRQHALMFDAMLCRPDGADSDKNPRFRAVAAGETDASRTPIEIVAFVGDNIQDFPGMRQSARAQGEGAFAEFGVRWFVLPNPMYVSWQ